MPENEKPPAVRVDVYYNSIKMIVKNSLHNIHKYILQQNIDKNQPHPSRLRGRGVEVCVVHFFIWGHSYPFDAYPNRWDEFEEFCKMMSGHPDIFYGTNKEILLNK